MYDYMASTITWPDEVAKEICPEHIESVKIQAGKIVLEKLDKFKDELYKEILKAKLLYWDDTVIMINAKRGCLRFYGNDKIAYYTAHNQKNEKGILEDNILNTLSKETIVMHDHNKINYKYSYQNIECNIHLIRDIEKCKMNTCHEWCDKLKQLIQTHVFCDLLLFPNDIISIFFINIVVGFRAF